MLGHGSFWSAPGFVLEFCLIEIQDFYNVLNNKWSWVPALRNLIQWSWQQSVIWTGISRTKSNNMFWFRRQTIGFFGTDCLELVGPRTWFSDTCMEMEVDCVLRSNPDSNCMPWGQRLARDFLYGYISRFKYQNSEICTFPTWMCERFDLYLQNLQWLWGFWILVLSIGSNNVILAWWFLYHRVSLYHLSHSVDTKIGLSKIPTDKLFSWSPSACRYPWKRYIRCSSLANSQKNIHASIY